MKIEQHRKNIIEYLPLIQTYLSISKQETAEPQKTAEGKRYEPTKERQNKRAY